MTNNLPLLVVVNHCPPQWGMGPTRYEVGMRCAIQTFLVLCTRHADTIMHVDDTRTTLN